MVYSNDFNKLFDRLFNSEPSYFTSTYKLVPINKEKDFIDEEEYEINYTKDGAYLHFEVPGFNKDTLEITIEGNELVLEGSRKYKLNGMEKEKKIDKRVKLNNNYDPTSMEATVLDGLLTVYIPSYNKLSEKKKNKININ